MGERIDREKVESCGSTWDFKIAKKGVNKLIIEPKTHTKKIKMANLQKSKICSRMISIKDACILGGKGTMEGCSGG